MRSSSAPSTEARTGPRAVHGTVFDVQRFALHDGPGIRTTVFLKGCPLRCGWCQNPESWLRRPQVVGGRTIGEVTTAGRVMEQVLRDRDYYAASGGGLTVSGGEPLAQADFTAALLELAHDAGVHTCLDTSGWAPERTIRRMTGLVDLWLFDLKATGEDEHRRLTGVAAGPVLANLDRLLAAGARVRLRLPLVPGVNDTDEHLEHVAAIVADHPELDGVDVLPYHSWGVDKAAELGIALPYGDLPTTSPEVAAELVERLHRLGCTAAR